MTKREKLSMSTPNIVDANISKIAKLFPNCITQVVKDWISTFNSGQQL